VEQFDNLFRVAPGTAYTAGNDAVASITLAHGGPMVVNICYSISTASKLLVRINGVNIPMNNDAALAAGAMGTFSFIAHPNDAFIIRFSIDGTIQYLVGTVSRG
jgi:hypothetical protein